MDNNSGHQSALPPLPPAFVLFFLRRAGVLVARPPFVPPGKYPAIYGADGNGSFLLATAIQRMLSLGAECPPADVIGIGYPTESGFVAAMTKRNRDYAPTDGGDYARAVLNSTVAPGGEAFLRFIREELKPSLEIHSQTMPDETHMSVSPAILCRGLRYVFGHWQP